MSGNIMEKSCHNCLLLTSRLGLHTVADLVSPVFMTLVLIKSSWTIS